jgi:hypothetical protein
MRRVLIAFLIGLVAAGFFARADDSYGAASQDGAAPKAAKAERAAQEAEVKSASTHPAPERTNEKDKGQARGDRKVLAQATRETRRVAERKERGKQVVAFWIILPEEAR